jgi:hypothetical protein
MNTMTKLVLVFVAFFAFSGVRANAQVFKSTIIGSTTPGLTIGGVLAARANWQVTKARIIIRNDGSFTIQLTGLVLVNGTNPVDQVAASLVCGGSGGAVAVTSQTFALSVPEGNADFSGQLTLPTSCLAPVVIVRVVGPNGPTVFIAATGFDPSAGDSAEGD